LPEPFALRTANSRAPTGASKTVLSPARETKEAPGVKTYSADEFTRLGISVETFTKRAMAAAEARLAQALPEFIKDEQGNTRYAVYRGDSSLIATLLIAPSLGNLVSKIFKTDIWAVVPDRTASTCSPPSPNSLTEFTGRLEATLRNRSVCGECRNLPDQGRRSSACNRHLWRLSRAHKSFDGGKRKVAMPPARSV